MKVRNAMCIFALFSIIALFFCFGVVANAEENSEDSGTSSALSTYFYSFSVNSMPFDLGYDRYTWSGTTDKPMCMYIIKRTGDLTNCIITHDLRTMPNYSGGTAVRYYNDGSTGEPATGAWGGWMDVGSLKGNLPVFDGTTAEGKAAAENYLKTGKLPEEKYNDKIDIPILVFKHEKMSDGTSLPSLTFEISNATEDYFVEMQGRNYSVDDVELYKENAVWKYKYSTVLYNDLTDWIPISSRKSSIGEFNLSELGKNSVANLNSTYPIDDRTYTGGTNALGNWLFGYSSALSQFKTLATTQGSAYLGTEIYIRFYYIDDNGDTQYGKWTHWYDNLASARGSSGSRIDDADNIDTYNVSQEGLTDDDKANLEKSGTSRYDSDAVSVNDNISSTSSLSLFKDFDPSNILTYFTSLIKTLLTATSNIAPFFNSIFGFLPVELRNVVYVTISAGCFCALIRFIFGKG